MSDPFYRLLEAVGRQGPGTVEDTQRAWAAVDAPAGARVADFGCGTGAATRTLLTHSDARVTALDRHAPFVAQLEQWARISGRGSRLETIVADMAEPPIPDESLDVAWSEASAYSIGFERALRRWWSLLKPGGYLAVSELVWSSSQPAENAVAFFAREYPDMSTVDERRAVAVAAGYRIIDAFMLSPAAWWEGYYAPLLAQAARMESASPSDEAVAEVVQAVRAEASIYREFGDSFGYLFLVLRRRSLD